MKESLRVTDVYDLTPTNGRKSFYGKARVKILSNGSKILQSYNTDIILKNEDGTLYLLCSIYDLSMTTCTHIKSFCGLCKKQVIALPIK